MSENIKFRFNKYEFDDSMKNMIEISSIRELIYHIISNKISFISLNSRLSENEISFEYAKYDHRNNWDTYYVKINNQIIGYSNGILYTSNELKQMEYERTKFLKRK